MACPLMSPFLLDFLLWWNFLLDDTLKITCSLTGHVLVSNVIGKPKE